jgi:predicted 2-oxoglutarate/Fe(II)-dependent dioxygenase YbiX
VRARYGADAEPVNHLVSWIAGRGRRGGEGAGEEGGARGLQSFNWLQHAVTGTYGPHVDKANQPQYDISALLYLGTAGEDFEGGLFAFNDHDCDRLVAPVAGRMLAFGSGFENLHQVRPVRSGERFVLSVWFRRGPGSER